MRIIERLEDFRPQTEPLILTVGNFDGMHRGHCAVLKKARALAGPDGEVVVLTFRNHPSEILKPDNPTKPICTLAHKLVLLERFGISQVLLLTFTRYLAQHSAASFIENIRQYISFSHLVLGHDATLGRDKQGNRAVMQELGDLWGFNVHYQEEYRYEGQTVSSTRIREALQQGDLEIVEQLLDHPYSIYGTVSEGSGKGKKLGYPTANIDVSGLCLPPYGVYAVQVVSDSKTRDGIANLGVAPTLREDPHPLLEIHLFDQNQNLYGQQLEVKLKQFIRLEKKFQNVEELRQQIQADILIAKKYFQTNII